MLTRLKVKGFKNLGNVDVSFGPFTCIAGPNAVGKSNLFDAIRFLSLLASRPLMEAAMEIRARDSRSWDPAGLFQKAKDWSADRMSFEAEMIVPHQALDDLGQTAEATATFLRYTVEIGLRRDRGASPSLGPLEFLKEDLVHIHSKDAKRHLLFPHHGQWQESVIFAKRRNAPYISTEEGSSGPVINLHQDGGARGRAVASLTNLPRTMLSAVNASEGPTAVCARREMESWRLLQLEPSALRQPDDFTAVPRMGPGGERLAATLYRLAHEPDDDPACHEAQVYCTLANRLAELIEDVSNVTVDRDEPRQLFTLQIAGMDGTVHPARSLSDGTLRFIALAITEMDATSGGLICLEEPENGIHPDRIPAMLQLLQDIATDADEPCEETNPLRQVIVNTHSPLVVREVPDDTLLIAEVKGLRHGAMETRSAWFGYLDKTWRANADEAMIVANGRLLPYLSPIDETALAEGLVCEGSPEEQLRVKDGRRRCRVGDRRDLQLNLFTDDECPADG